MNKHIWSIGYSLVLTAFTIYITLDTFVLEKSYNTNAVETNTSMFNEIEESDTEDIMTETSDTKHSGKHKSKSPGSHRFTSKAAGLDSESSTNSSDADKDNMTNSSDTASEDTINSSDSEYEDNKNSTNSDSESDTNTTEQSKEYDSSYSDENISIKLSEYRENDTQIYVADITLTSAEYLKTAFANDTYGKNVTANTSEIASDHNAILAINGDYYGVQESGYVIRNGVVYRDKADGSDVLCIYANGTMEIINDSEYTADELVEKGVWQALTFGPGLIDNGVISVDTDDEVDMAMSSNPRTAIGIIDKNHFVFVVSDGRTSESEGLSLYELAEFMDKLGVETAYNLDGGGSSTMYFGGQVINNPTSGHSIKEREVSDIVYIG